MAGICVQRSLQALGGGERDLVRIEREKLLRIEIDGGGDVQDVETPDDFFGPSGRLGWGIGDWGLGLTWMVEANERVRTLIFSEFNTAGRDNRRAAEAAEGRGAGTMERFWSF